MLLPLLEDGSHIVSWHIWCLVRNLSWFADDCVFAVSLPGQKEDSISLVSLFIRKSTNCFHSTGFHFHYLFIFQTPISKDHHMGIWMDKNIQSITKYNVLTSHYKFLLLKIKCLLIKWIKKLKQINKNNIDKVNLCYCLFMHICHFDTKMQQQKIG